MFDKDERAVDICKLNLSLKLAERGQKLPELHHNIKCGDSLIDDKEIADDKAFNWNEKFKSIMDNGGFDVVIGNPPYGAEFEKNEREYFKKHYSNISVVIDSYILFIERAVKLLKNGTLGFIIPESWLTNPSNWNLRKYLLENTSILKIVDIPGMVFPDAMVDTIILTFKRQNPLNHKVKILFAKPKKAPGNRRQKHSGKAKN